MTRVARSAIRVTVYNGREIGVDTLQLDLNFKYK